MTTNGPNFDNAVENLKNAVDADILRKLQNTALMKSRGYETYHNTGSFCKKVFESGDREMDDCTFFIYAEIKQSMSGDVVKLSSEPMGHFMTIESGEFQLTHPNFRDFENRIVRYILACKRTDAYAKPFEFEKKQE